MSTKTQHDTTPLVDNSYYEAVTAAIRQEARRILESGEVTAVIGYTAGRRQGSAQPVIVTDPAKADNLVFSPACVNNLALYLTKAKKEVSKKGKLAIVAKGCDLKALAGLMGESQLKRENLHIIGIACPGVHGSNIPSSEPLSAASIARKCRECTVHDPEGVDIVAGTMPKLEQLSALESEELARLEAMTPAERWAFWKEHLSRCIRCMACRQICPFC
jgi:coenzyme F420-reducing hydrogenase beta subunit